MTNSIAAKLPLAGGTMTGELSLGANKIVSVANPTLAQDVATKAYVDAADTTGLPLAGGTMSGAIAMGTNKITGMGDPTAAQDAATKAYTDSILGSATSAATSASAAATSASNASTSASGAATSATNAGNSETAAASSAAEAATTYDDFDDRYLGDKASDPTVDNDGNALLTGALYFNTTSDAMKVYTGSAWAAVAPTATSVTVSQISDYTGTAAELNYTDGVTSAIQTQLDAKPDNLADLGVTASSTELNYTDGVTSPIQTQLDAKDNNPIQKGANYTALAGDNIVVTAGSITITLPASPSAGDTVGIKDGTGAAETATFTVARNGSNIASSGTDLVFDKNFAEITMMYIDATIGWSV